MGRITSQELDEELLSQLGTGVAGDAVTLDGKPASYYDQSEHVADTDIHVNQEMRDKISDTYSKGETDTNVAGAMDSAKSYTDTKLGELADVSPEMYNALVRVAELVRDNPDTFAAVMEAIAEKAAQADFTTHTTTTNPHNITKSTIGLDKVDNTPDNEKNVATAKKLAAKTSLIFEGDVTGSVNFDGEGAAKCTLTYTGGNEEGNDTVAGEYTKIEINDRGQIINASNPQTLEGYGIVDAATAEQGKAADSAVQAIYVGLQRQPKLNGVIPELGGLNVHNVIMLPEYPTDAETLNGKTANDFAPSNPVSLKDSGLMTPAMYLRLYESLSELDQLSVYKEDLDADGIFRTVRYCKVEYGDDGLPLETIYKISKLEGTGPFYETRKEELYVNNKVITRIYKLGYDNSGNLISEVAESNVINE